MAPVSSIYMQYSRGLSTRVRNRPRAGAIMTSMGNRRSASSASELAYFVVHTHGFAIFTVNFTKKRFVPLFGGFSSGVVVVDYQVRSNLGDTTAANRSFRICRRLVARQTFPVCGYNSYRIKSLAASVGCVIDL